MEDEDGRRTRRRPRGALGAPFRSARSAIFIPHLPPPASSLILRPSSVTRRPGNPRGDRGQSLDRDLVPDEPEQVSLLDPVAVGALLRDGGHDRRGQEGPILARAGHLLVIGLPR